MAESEGLSAVLKRINDTYGDLTIIKAKGSKALAKVIRVPTGVLAFDIASGGGIPRGRMTLLTGEPSSGKSVMALKSAAAFQRFCRNCGKPMFSWDELRMKRKPKICCKDPQPNRVVWFDAEGCWTNDWAERMGVDTEHLYVIRAEYAEQGIDVADAIIRSGECDLLVVDSVAALTPSVEIEESAEKWQMGVHARLMNKAMRKWTSASHAQGFSTFRACSIILINQIRHKIGVIYGSPETMPGGKGIPFHSSMTVKVKRKGYVEREGHDQPEGIKMEMHFIKNKTAPPMRTAAVSVAFRHQGYNRKAGSANIGEQVLAMGVYHKIFKKSGAWYTIAKGLRFQGAEAAGAALEDPSNAKLLNMAMAEITKRELDWING